MASTDVISSEGIVSIINSAFEKAVREIMDAHKAAGQVATGKTLRSLEYTLSREGKRYCARILGRPYFGSVETGRGPYNGGKADPAGFNARLVEWMKARHFALPDEKAYTRMANYLRWRINKFGTDLYRKGGRKDIFTPAVEELQEVLEKELKDFFSIRMENMFTAGFQGFGK